MRPKILFVNDDIHLCATRKMLFESCGATVYTACGDRSDVEKSLQHPLDLVIIDSTNVGYERGEQLCSLVKQVAPSLGVALLAKPESGLPEKSSADHLVLRTGPRQMLVRINELLGERLDVNLWKLKSKHVNEGFIV